MKLTFLLSAELDIQRAFDRYESRQEGRGDAFAQHLEEAFGRISTFPHIAPLHFENYRRLVLTKFPFGIFYVVETNQVAIHAIMDLRQDPDLLRRRLRGEL
jgi:plasmid stabilization system protein ParE